MSGVIRAIWWQLAKRLHPLQHSNDTREWTKAVMQGLLDCKGLLAKTFQIPEQQIRAFHHSRVEETPPGEYLLDLVLTTLPQRFDWTADGAWDFVPFEALLAAESEWGFEKDPARCYSAVLYDFCKLIDFKARVKVMIYGCHLDGKVQAAALQETFARILRQHRGYDPREEWLFVGMPWDRSWMPQVHILTHTATSGLMLIDPKWESTPEG